MGAHLRAGAPSPSRRSPSPHGLKHLPEELWPPEDRALFDAAFASGDIFEENGGAGAHLAEATRRAIIFAWRRYLGFLKKHRPGMCWLEAADRVTPGIVRDYVEHLQAEVSASSVAITVSQLYDCIRLIAPDRDWTWLKALKARLHARAKPQDRFDRLMPAQETLDLGLALMDDAIGMPISGRKEREVQFRDGLIVALISLWPIRRRSIAALTVSRHLKLSEGAADVILCPEDTKAKRDASWPVPDALVPYLKRYLLEIRPRLVGASATDALWPSLKGGGLGGDRIYNMVRRRTEAAFGRGMALHDFRRAAATFLAMEAPEKVGLTPGILGHANPEVSDRHYNLARSTSASRRHVQSIAAVRARLRYSGTDGGSDGL